MSVRHHHYHGHDRYSASSFFSFLRRKFVGFGSKSWKISYGIFAGSLILLPLLYFGGESWWFSLASLLWGVSLFFCFLAVYRRASATHFSFFSRHILLALLLFLLPVMVGAIQLIPWTKLAGFLAPECVRLWQSFHALGVSASKDFTVSLAPEATWGRMQLWIFSGVAFLMAYWFLRKRESLIFLLLALGLGGIFGAIYAFFSHWNPVEFSDASEFSGMFLNRNHFAFFEVIGIFSLAALLGILRGGQMTMRSVGLTSFEEGDSTVLRKRLFLLAGIFLQVAALLMTQSRGGFIAFFTAVFFFVTGALFRIANRKHRDRRWYFQPFPLLILVFLVGLFFGLYSCLQRVLARMEELDSLRNSDLRPEVWQYTWKLIRRFWQSGTGLGSFYTVFQTSGSKVQQLARNAHNDYLELMLEMGIPAAALWFCGVIGTWAVLLKRILRRHSSAAFWGGLGACSALTGMAVHEMVDYSLLAWPNALYGAVMVALAFRCAWGVFPSELDLHKQEHQKHRVERNAAGKSENETDKCGHWGKKAWCIVSVFLVLFAVFPPWRMISGLRIAAARRQIRIALADVNAASYYDSRNRVNAVADMMKIAGASSSRHALKARYLWQTFCSAPISEKAIWLEEACREVSAALSGAPCLPVEALACAVFYDVANQWGFRRDSGHFLFSLYEWAILCQPNEASVLRQALPGAWRGYLQALFDGSAVDRQQLRARMLVLFRHGFRAIPASVEFCRLLKQADCTADEYENIFSETSEGRLVMGRMLVRMNRLEEALALCRPLRRACQTQDVRQGVLRLLRSAIGLEMEILEKLNRAEERKELWEQLRQLQADRAERAGQRAETLLDATQMENALALLQNALRRGAVTPALIFQACHYEIQMGRGEQIPYLLMYFLTFGNARRNLSDVREARELLAESGTDWFGKRPLAIFLPAAFVVMQAESDASSCSREDLREAVRSLENMVNRKVTSQANDLENMVWGQLHLAPLFAARGWILLRKTNEAVRCYRKVLEISPRNLYAIEGLHQLDSSQLTPEEMEYWKLVHSRKEPICRFDNGITWLAAQGTPEVLTEKTPCQTIRLLFCVEHSVTNLTAARFEFQDRGGKQLFTGKMRFPPKDGKALQARPLGELFLIEGMEYFLAAPSQMFPAGDVYLKMVWLSHEADRHQYGAPVVKIATLNP